MAFFFLIIVLLFSYSCLHFLPIIGMFYTRSWGHWLVQGVGKRDGGVFSPCGARVRAEEEHNPQAGMSGQLVLLTRLFN